jgi:ABC-type spermidine/putrescine transport system permease subunit I
MTFKHLGAWSQSVHVVSTIIQASFFFYKVFRFKPDHIIQNLLCYLYLYISVIASALTHTLYTCLVGLFVMYCLRLLFPLNKNHCLVNRILSVWLVYLVREFLFTVSSNGRILYSLSNPDSPDHTAVVLSL